MSLPDLTPRHTIGGVVAVWIVAALLSIGAGIFAPPGWRIVWLTVGLGGCLILAFAIQLSYGRSKKFIERMAASVLGALVVMALVSAIVGLVALLLG